jgi:nucleotidyltransferase substrate binding protein (TIGR01987 family)
MSAEDIRWIQRLNHFKQAYGQLRNAVDLTSNRELTELEEQGMIQAFEYTHELAWKTMKNFFRDKANINLYGSKDTTREAFRQGLIENGETWMKMIEHRNLSTHTYNREVAREIADAVSNVYWQEFEKLITRLEAEKPVS